MGRTNLIGSSNLNTNNTCVFGSMAGLAPTTNVRSNISGMAGYKVSMAAANQHRNDGTSIASNQAARGAGCGLGKSCKDGRNCIDYLTGKMLTALEQAQGVLDAANATSAVAQSMLLAAATARANFFTGSAVISTLTSDIAVAAAGTGTSSADFRRDLTTALDAHAVTIAGPTTLAAVIATEEDTATDLINFVSNDALLADAVTVLGFAGLFSAALAESAIKNDLRDYFDLKKKNEFAREAAAAAVTAVSDALAVRDGLA
tara:strand:- start:2093 stop:2872 length:780 start_codon:yes stop_codon:yes gene_type:complete